MGPSSWNGNSGRYFWTAEFDGAFRFLQPDSRAWTARVLFKSGSAWYGGKLRRNRYLQVSCLFFNISKHSSSNFCHCVQIYVTWISPRRLFQNWPTIGSSWRIAFQRAAQSRMTLKMIRHLWTSYLTSTLSKSFVQKAFWYVSLQRVSRFSLS